MAADWMLEEHGLASVEGGRHPGWGTANRVVPLGPNYLELLGVVDEKEAASSPTGTWLASVLPDGDRPVAWAIATDDVEAEAVRLGLEILPGSRETPDGTTLRWRLAGVERAMADGSFPFFIQWDVPPELHPGRASVPHRVEPRGIAWVQVGGEEGPIRDWLGPGLADVAGLGQPGAGVRAVGGSRGLLAVGVATARGEAVVGP